MKTKTINYIYDGVQEAVQSYHILLRRLERWETTYPNYEFEIYLRTTGITRKWAVTITVKKHT